MYVIVDPVNDDTKGITTYSNLLYDLLRKNNIDAFLIRKRIDQDIKCFYEEIAQRIDVKKHLFEIPDSYCYLFNHEARVHIRLHGNQTVLQKIQGHSIDTARQAAEEKRILESEYISSPSESNFLETAKFIHIKKCSIYPNPVPEAETTFWMPRDIEILFLGRFQRLKGVEFIRPIEKILNKKILVYSKNFNPLNKLFYHFAPSVIPKKNLLRRTKVVIIPSLFESFSMVKYEALSNGCKVVTWDTTPCSDYELKNGVFVAKAFHPDDFAQKITDALNDKCEYDFRLISKKINELVLRNIRNIIEAKQ